MGGPKLHTKGGTSKEGNCKMFAGAYLDQSPEDDGLSLGLAPGGGPPPQGGRMTDLGR